MRGLAMETVNFTRMADGVVEEYAFLEPLYAQTRAKVPATLLNLLRAMQGERLGYRVDRYTHSHAGRHSGGARRGGRGNRGLRPPARCGGHVGT